MGQSSQCSCYSPGNVKDRYLQVDPLVPLGVGVVHLLGLLDLTERLRAVVHAHTHVDQVHVLEHQIITNLGTGGSSNCNWAGAMDGRQAGTFVAFVAERHVKFKKSILKCEKADPIFFNPKIKIWTETPDFMNMK